jgi:hypothetical protein
MHPLMFFAIAAQERDERARDSALVWRNAHARDVSPSAQRRDARWAAAIARRAAAARRSAVVAPTKVPCDGLTA